MSIFGRLELGSESNSEPGNNPDSGYEFMRKYSTLLSHSAEDDKTWKDWVDFIDSMHTGRNNLKNLLLEDVCDCFKARALFLLLVPDRSTKEFYWKKKLDSLWDDVAEIGFPKDLSMDLSNLTSEMLQEIAVEVKNGAKKYSDPFYFYCAIIRELLPFLSEEDGKKLLEVYPLDDPKSWNDTDSDWSGYSPSYQLLRSDKISDGLKSFATDKMLEVILSEKKNRRDWKNHLFYFARMIQTVNEYAGEDRPYSIDLFARQIDFIVGLEVKGKKMINLSYLRKMLELFKDNDELKLKLIRFVVLKDGGKMSIDAAEAMLTEAERQEDSQVIKALGRFLKKAKKEDSETEERIRRRKDEEKRKRGKILAAMR